MPEKHPAKHYLRSASGHGSINFAAAGRSASPKETATMTAWGRGIQKIYEECDLIGAKIPEYSILGDDITVKFAARFSFPSTINPNLLHNSLIIL